MVLRLQTFDVSYDGNLSCCARMFERQSLLASVHRDWTAAPERLMRSVTDRPLRGSSRIR